MRRECRERFSRHRLQRKPLISDPGMYHGTCVTHVPWCMSGSPTRGGGENVPDIPDACATRNYAHQARGPCGWSRSCLEFPSHMLRVVRSRNLIIFTGDPLHSRAACTQPCNVNTHSRAHCSPGARLCEQWGHGCVNNGARLCASARLCRGSPVILPLASCLLRWWQAAKSVGAG